MGRVCEDRYGPYDGTLCIGAWRLLKVFLAHLSAAGRAALDLGDQAKALVNGIAETAQGRRVANHALKFADTVKLLGSGDLPFGIADYLLKKSHLKRNYAGKGRFRQACRQKPAWPHSSLCGECKRLGGPSHPWG